MRNLLKKIFNKLSTFNSHFSISKGFTLIELLVVIAVLGVLAAIVLLAVNPGEQLARARDTNRVSAVTQIGRSLQSYYTANNGIYPDIDDAGITTPAGPDWLITLQNSQDLKTIPTNPAGAATCDTVSPVVNVENGWCYSTGTLAGSSEAIVYTRLEATLNDNKCLTPADEVAWWLFSTVDGRGGVWCNDGTAEPTIVSYAGLFRD